ncbi:hypothetical protein D6D10_07500 [Aureobasidium pullulans]|uniref:BTB domain-containing protein n=1 Tax=Aureobasidium pullulans TaxID=5580 RepID=A0A4V4J740_AURPU|nr:hypothetical protein D6D10_07500 [Aureobasidium pullulans]
MDWTNDLLYQRPELFTSKKQKLYNNPALSDVIVQFGEYRLYGHKAILANGGSVWFEKALLGNFSEAKQDILDLGEEDDPDAVCALIKHLYGDTYHEQDVPFDHGEYDNHLTVYTIGDKYDSATLRQQALNRLLSSIESELSYRDIPVPVIHFIQKILGPSAIVFGDKAIQTGVCQLVSKYVYNLWNSKTFAALLIKGDMLDEEYSESFRAATQENMCERRFDNRMRG